MMMLFLFNSRWKSPKFDTSQIRLVLFQDHDIRGRLLLFDSKAIKKIDTGQVRLGLSTYHIHVQDLKNARLK